MFKFMIDAIYSRIYCNKWQTIINVISFLYTNILTLQFKSFFFVTELQFTSLYDTFSVRVTVFSAGCKRCTVVMCWGK